MTPDPQLPPAVPKTAPNAERAEQVQPPAPERAPNLPETFAFRPAGEDENITVALDDLGPCPVCGHDVHPGAFAVWVDDPEAHGWAHESCARPQNPTRPALNAHQTRTRS